MPSVVEYFETLAQTAGLADEDKAALKKVLSNQKFVEEVDKGVKRQSDYSRAMDEHRKEAERLEADKKSWREWYNGAVTNDAAREAELQELRAKVGGNNNSNPNPNPNPAPTGLTKKELDESQGQMVQIIKQVARISSRHAAKFHEELDVDAVEKIAREKGLSVDRAYEDYVAPRIKAEEEQSFAEKLKQAREEGVKEGLSKRDLPDESTRGFHLIHDHNKSVEASGKLTDAQRRANFESAWTESVLKK